MKSCLISEVCMCVSVCEYFIKLTICVCLCLEADLKLQFTFRHIKKSSEDPTPLIHHPENTNTFIE